MAVCNEKECWKWPPPEGEDECDDCVDGRDIQVVYEYASTCDGYQKLVLHEGMIMDRKTQLGYCPECAARQKRKKDWKRFFEL